MSGTRVYGWLMAILLSCAASVGLIAVASPASAAPTANRPVLLMDPYAHCGWNSPFLPQVKELGWRIFQKGPQGTYGGNDWKCVYLVNVTVPVGNTKGDGRGGVSADDAVWSMPGAMVTVRFPIDWRQMCKDQYGSTADIVWVGKSSVPGSIGPWQCLGQAGKRYEQYDMNTIPPRLKGSINALLH